MSRRRDRRRAKKERHAQPPAIVREASKVERLAYTRTQSAEALGISRSTFNRRVLPYVETVVMPWGARLIPADELERLLAERRRAAQARPEPRKRGRPPAVPWELVELIRAKHAAGQSLGQIARDLNDDGVRTAQLGGRWWASTVRAILLRSRSVEST